MSTLIALTTTGATQIAAVADACSSDSGRPILNAVKFELVIDDTKEGIRQYKLSAVATDSYSLALREITLTPDAVLDFHADDWDEDNHLLVNGKQLKAALKSAAANKAGKGKILMEFTPRSSDHEGEGLVAREFGDHPEVKLPLTVGTFPKYRSLIPDGAGREYNGNLPAFDPAKLAKLSTYVSTTPSERNKQPFTLMAGSDGSELKPFLFVHGGKESKLTALLMPVRV